MHCYQAERTSLVLATDLGCDVALQFTISYYLQALYYMLQQVHCCSKGALLARRKSRHKCIEAFGDEPCGLCLGGKKDSWACTLYSMFTGALYWRAGAVEQRFKKCWQGPMVVALVL